MRDRRADDASHSRVDLPPQRVVVGRPARPYESVLRLQGAIGNRATARLLRQPTGVDADQSPPPPPPKQLPGSLRVRIVAHASPRWRSANDAKGADRENLELSRKRLQQVKDVVDVRLQDRLGPNVRIDYDLEYVDPDAPGTVLMTGEAHGSQETLNAAKGNRTANDPYYRRVDVYIDDTASTENYAQRSRPHTTHKVHKTTRSWGVAVRMSSSITAGASAGIISVRLKNLDTGRYGDYHLISGGGGTLGVGVAVPFDDDYTEFSTDEPVGFDDFDGVWTRYSTVGAGLVFVGYQRSYISFIGMGSDAQSINVGGWSYGAHLELGGSVTSGKLGPDGGSGPSDFYDEAAPDVDVVPYETSDTRKDLHMAFFATGSWVLPPADRTDLRKYVDRATARFVQSVP
jgi:hypothetical protein